MNASSKTQGTKRDDVMRRVQAMLDKAAATTFDEERATFLAKAEQLMTSYAIETFELEANKPKDHREQPVVVDVQVATSDEYDVRSYLSSIFTTLAAHCDVMIGRGHTLDSTTKARTWKCVGYETDIRYLQMLYLSVQVALVRMLEPKVDPAKSELENYAHLRDAGVEIKRILPLLGHEYYLPGYRPNGKRNTNRTVIARLRKQYRRMCDAEGREYVEGPTGEAYRTTFLYTFQGELATRLRAMKGERDEATSGHALAIVDRKDASRNLLWETWPEMAPHPADCDCESCHYGRCRDSKCSRSICVEMRKPVRRSAAPRTVRWVDSAAKAGRAAARSTDLSRGHVGGGSSGELS